MALGESTFKIRAGGGQQRASAATLARTVIQLGVSPGGTEAALAKYGDVTAMLAALDTGPLAEAASLRHRSGLTLYVVPLKPSSAGAVGTVTQKGTGTGTITPSKVPHRLVEITISTAGALGTMKFRWRVGGSGAYSAEVASTSSPDPNLFRVPGTFCTLSFAGGNYVLNSTYTVGLDGVVTIGGGGINTVTQASDPIDAYEVVCTVVKGGALGAAVLRISLDNGKTQLPDMLVPASGKVVVPGAGILLTCANTFTADESYSFLTAPPGYSTSDITAALTAIRADQTSPRAALVHLVGLASSAANAFSAAATLDTQLVNAFNSDGLDWQGLVELPVKDDIVISGGAAIRDTADTDSAISTARQAQADLTRTAVAAGTHRIVSPITGRQQQRPLGWAMADRFVDTDPRDDLSAPEPFGALVISEIGRDEAKTPALDDLQLNTARSYRGRNGAYLSITDAGFGFKNLTTSATFQDAGAMRVLDVAVASLRPVGQGLLGQRPAVNADGTIEETAARDWDALVDGAFKRAVGLLPGGDFKQKQASVATARVLRSSQLGTAPRRLDIEYTLQPLGFVSKVSGEVLYSGVINLKG